ncbi:nitrilase [Rhodococcus rhodnii]|uniref:Nitrilase n=2 Tax=Rhodococcus rhodnii TaxID=38312 RepID=R7WQ69_9NOCA|nr:carbon-nitrogen hydrolase family protein [Rhodococcus rhodnii]EOM77462.1 nitrilase [Rhodococcus rhodnii LMG 5362]TXG90339.1 nitrilase [Rhodococcus rhodnii]
MHLTVAALQTPGTPGDVTANLAELDEAAARAVAGGAGLLVTPELFVTGYDIGDAVRELASPSTIDAAAVIAQRHGIAIVLGAPEQSGDLLYNTAFFIDDTGDIIARHRKSHLFGELDQRYFTAGDRAATLVDHRGVRIALMICYDVEFPENVRAAAAAGAHLVAVPTAQMTPFEYVAEHVVRTRAWENQVYLAYVNHDGHEGDTEYVGRSSIVGPDAGVLDSAVHGRALLTAVVDTEVVAEAQQRNPYLLDRRPDLPVA